MIFLSINHNVGIHTLSKICSPFPPKAAFLLVPAHNVHCLHGAALVLLGELELHLNRGCEKMEPE